MDSELWRWDASPLAAAVRTRRISSARRSTRCSDAGTR
jgi:hypothetical protein